MVVYVGDMVSIAMIQSAEVPWIGGVFKGGSLDSWAGWVVTDCASLQTAWRIVSAAFWGEKEWNRESQTISPGSWQMSSLGQ